MHSGTPLLGLLAATVAAQNMTDLPECARTCRLKAVNDVGCPSPTDFH